jgi:hypothetical protein
LLLTFPEKEEQFIVLLMKEQLQPAAIRAPVVYGLAAFGQISSRESYGWLPVFLFCLFIRNLNHYL